MIGGHHVLAAILGPFHRASDQLGRGRDQVILGVEFAARSKSTADIDLDQVDGLHFEVERGSQHSPVVPRRLCCAPDRELAGLGVPLRDKAARLHEHRGMALNLEGFASRIIGGSKNGVRIALEGLPGDGRVRAVVLEQHGRHGFSLLTVRDCGQRLDIEIEMIERVLRNTRRIRQHHGDRFADVANLAIGQHWLVKRLKLRKRLQPERNPWHDATKIGANHDVTDSGQLHRAGDVDRVDLAVGHRAAQNHSIKLPRPVYVGDIGSPAAQEAQVLSALHRLTDIGIARFHAFSF